MARVSDERVEMEATGTASYIPGIERHLARDLRDARALLREAEFWLQSVVRDRPPRDKLFEVQDRIRQHLEGHDEQG